jgi:hypothetical protein
MAALLPKTQHFVDLRNGTQALITKVTLKTTAGAGDTITLPQFSNTTISASVAQVRDTGEAAVTVASVIATGVVTITGGVAGAEVTLCSLHPHINSSTT